MMSPACRIILLLASLLIVPGCVKPVIVNAFDGPDRPAAEVATLELDFKLRLTQLDGRRVPGVPAGFDEHDPHNPRVVRLLPGSHELIVGKRPYVETHTHNTYTYLPSGDCHGGGGGGMQQIWTGSYTTTTHALGSRDDERIAFNVAAGRRYRVALDDPIDWFSKRDRWRVKVVEQTDAWRDRVVSTSFGRQRHVRPSAVEIELARYSETTSPPP
jgi:hypothetical protein